MKQLLGIVLGSICLVCTAFSAEITIEQAPINGKLKTKKVPLEIQDNHARFRMKLSEIGTDYKWIALKADFARAKKGEKGYFVFPNGHLGFFTRDTGREKFYAPNMPIFGMKTERGTFVAIISGMPYNFSLEMRVKNGQYELLTIYDRAIPQAYEDIVVDYYWLTGDDANYSGMARRYRKYQLDHKVVRPLKARVKNSEELAYAVQYPEVRIRQGWKPVPSPVMEQTVQNEPPMKAVVTFDRVMRIVDECKRQKIEGLELCLVGWNQKGHDGRWPQIFPVEESLGGEAKLRQAIKYAQKNGYQIVAHGNHLDAYMIADSWDAEYIMEKKDGLLVKGNISWGGGRNYTICPQRAYERFALKDMPSVAALGFRGLHYLDVYSCVRSPRCTDPRHPLNERQSAKYIGAIMQLARDTFGGCASEGSYDHFAGQLDSALYVSFDNPLKKMPALTDRLIPIWQLVYHGIILSNPFTTTVNPTIKGRASELKLVEFGGRPNFYIHANFKSSGNNWMGEQDLTCETDAALKRTVSMIKKGADEYSKLYPLQYCFMENHEELQPKVFITVYSDGTEIITNYGKESVTVRNVTIPAESYKIMRTK